jgi:lysophospholipase L1-like esterase
MIDCLIVGDSIAVGTHQYRPECVAYAKGGINSSQWNKQNSNKNLTAKTVIISLGSNDHVGVRTMWELQQLRARTDAERVFWILPAIKPDVQEMVRIIAQDHGDVILPILNLQADKIHPSWAGYKKLAEQTR